MKKLLTVVAALSIATAVQAHVTIAPNEAKPGQQTMVKIHVGHGCDGKPTSQVRVDIPRALTMAHPQDVPGWTLVSKASGHRTTRVTWTAMGEAPESTPDFEIHIGLPGSEQMVYIPVTQTCGKDVVRWTAKPSASGKAPDHPAPSVKVTLYPDVKPVLHLH